jgi:hypothetical protein
LGTGGGEVEVDITAVMARFGGGAGVLVREGDGGGKSKGDDWDMSASVVPVWELENWVPEVIFGFEDSGPALGPDGGDEVGTGSKTAGGTV